MTDTRRAPTASAIQSTIDASLYVSTETLERRVSALVLRPESDVERTLLDQLPALVPHGHAVLEAWLDTVAVASDRLRQQWATTPVQNDAEAIERVASMGAGGDVTERFLVAAVREAMVHAEEGTVGAWVANHLEAITDAALSLTQALALRMSDADIVLSDGPGDRPRPDDFFLLPAVPPRPSPARSRQRALRRVTA